MKKIEILCDAARCACDLIKSVSLTHNEELASQAKDLLFKLCDEMKNLDRDNDIQKLPLHTELFDQCVIKEKQREEKVLKNIDEEVKEFIDSIKQHN